MMSYKITCLILFFPGLFGACELLARTSKTDSLRTVLATLPDDTNKANTLIELGNALKEKTAYSDAFSTAGELLRLSEKLEYDKGLYHGLLISASICREQSNYSLSLDFYRKALKNAIASGIPKRLSAVYGGMGIVYKLEGNLTLSLDYNLKALKIDEQIGNQQGIASRYNNIGIIYKNLGEYDKALDCYDKVLAIVEKLDDQSQLQSTLGNIGVVYRVKKEYAKALDYYTRSLNIAKARKDEDGIARQLGNIGVIHYELGLQHPGQKKYWMEKAAEYYRQALVIYDHLDQKNSRMIQLGNLGAMYKELGDYAQAERYLLDALDLANATQSLVDKSVINNNLSELYADKGEWKKALDAYRKGILYKDSVSNQENTREQTRLELQYEFDKKQAADSIANAAHLAQEELRHNQEIQQQKLYTLGGITGFILMVIVALISLQAYRQKQKANEIITEQKMLVERKQKEILDSIYYAKRIQQSALPTHRYIHHALEKLRQPPPGR
jgi:tetratricopeptide (TPR) repeat protein